GRARGEEAGAQPTKRDCGPRTKTTRRPALLSRPALAPPRGGHGEGCSVRAGERLFFMGIPSLPAHYGSRGGRLSDGRSTSIRPLLAAVLLMAAGALLPLESALFVPPAAAGGPPAASATYHEVWRQAPFLMDVLLQAGPLPGVDGA